MVEKVTFQLTGIDHLSKKLPRFGGKTKTKKFRMIQKSVQKPSVEQKEKPTVILQRCSCPSDKNLLLNKILGVSNNQRTFILVKFAAS